MTLAKNSQFVWYMFKQGSRFRTDAAFSAEAPPGFGKFDTVYVPAGGLRTTAGV